MPWNEPGQNGNNHDPWGGKKEQGPPDLDKFLSDLLNKFRGLLNHKKNKPTWQPPETHLHKGMFAGIMAAIFIILWFLSGFFIVNQAEEAVILRFGKYATVLQPGLHWMARFIDTKYLVDVKKIYSFSIEGDFLTKSAEQSDLPNSYIAIDKDKKAPEFGDQSKNLVNVELNVQYRIVDPRAYLFNVVDPDTTIQEVASGALSDRVGQMKLDEVLTTGRENLSSGVLTRIKQVLLPYNTGFEVLAVTLRKVQAPDQVRAAFNDVNRADQDKATYIQQAQAYASKVVPLAQGEAARILANANGYQQQVVLAAQANVAKYDAILKVYTIAPQVTQQRMYLETLQTIFQHTSKILVDSNTNNLIYVPLDKLINQKHANVENDASQAPRLPTLSFGQSEPTSTEVRNDPN